MKKSTFLIGSFSFVLVALFGGNKNSYQTAVSDLISENVEALAQNETASGYAEVSCCYMESIGSDGDVIQTHAIMCEGSGDKACTCSHEK